MVATAACVRRHGASAVNEGSAWRLLKVRGAEAVVDDWMLKKSGDGWPAVGHSNGGAIVFPILGPPLPPRAHYLFPHAVCGEEGRSPHHESRPWQRRRLVCVDGEPMFSTKALLGG